MDFNGHFGPGKNGCVFGKNIINTEHRLTWKQKGDSFLIETVDGNKAKYSRRDVDRAAKTRRFEEIAAFPSLKIMRHMVHKNVIKDSPITNRDLSITYKMFGRSIHSFQGKRTRKRNEALEVEEAFSIPVPPTIKQFYAAITLCVDVM